MDILLTTIAANVGTPPVRSIVETLIGKRDQKHETINVKDKAARDCLAFEQYKRITLCCYIVDGCVSMSAARAEFSSELMGEVIGQTV